MSKPIIGVTTFCGQEKNKDYGKVRCSYIKAISEADSLPVLIPQLESRDKVEKYIKLIDGLILSGGKDVSPVYYGEKPSQEVTELNPVRDKWELDLFGRAYKENLPVLGVCRGMQLMNVALGGTLYQDLNKDYSINRSHWPASEDYSHHKIKVTDKGQLYQALCSDKLEVNSYHHQAIKELAADFVVVANSQGGVIEAIEAPQKDFVVGVQWHPEDLINQQPCFSNLFKAVAAQAKRKKKD